jgi:ParB-like chromosome segregation protein Spo0J
MNRYREAIHFYTRALKYLTRIENEFSLQQLQLSISLGEALIQTKNTRDKGVHLLNTMLHKATKLNATAEHKQIVDILLNARSNSLDILGLWHKMFPK